MEILNQPAARHRFPIMSTSALRILLTAIAALLTASCANKTDPEDEKSQPQPRMEIVGRIASMPPGRSYVLIQSFGDWKVADGTILTTRGADDRTASLRVTGEKLGQFAAADIQAGQAAVGDVVVLLPPSQPTTTNTPPHSPAPEPEFP